MKLLLASGSPRRADVLRRAGFLFDTMETRVDETRAPGEGPETFVQRLAIAKAQAAADDLLDTSGPTLIIGADTTVVAGGALLEKPTDAKDARRMLRLLSGKTHEVLTGVALMALPDGRGAKFVDRTRVDFAELSERQIDDYIATGESFGKAGGYAIQGFAGRFVERIEGCYFNVMGMPLSRVWTAMLSLGWKDPEA
ncbi:MAG TPA: Maf family protein [Verrucomicrobiae bacterium]|nr:Maf family protein [Verrucomicrobiae bacterium]